jgi:hypothetical protein
MALKFKYKSKEEVPVEYLPFYAEREGVWQLDADGVADKARLNEFRITIPRCSSTASESKWCASGSFGRRNLIYRGPKLRGKRREGKSGEVAGLLNLKTEPRSS